MSLAYTGRPHFKQQNKAISREKNERTLLAVSLKACNLRPLEMCIDQYRCLVTSILNNISMPWNFTQTLIMMLGMFII